MQPEEARDGLARFIQRKTGATSVEFTDTTRLSGGASRETWSFDARIVHPGGREELLEGILRADPVRGIEPSPGRALEYNLIKAAWENGVVVPEPLWDGDDDIFGVKFFVMRRVPGEALGARLIRAPQYAHTRTVFTEQLAQSLARIHRVDPSRYPEFDILPRPAPGASPAELQIETYANNLAVASDLPHPVFELAIRWLRAHMPPPPAERVLVHGDFRLGNVMFDEHGITGVIDWELAHFGDPLEDFGYLMIRSWRFGGNKPVAGVGEREAFYEAYEKAGGFPVDRERVRYWEILNNLKWGVITVMQGFSYLDGRNPNVEHATIGRRPAETEIELLELLDGA